MNKIIICSITAALAGFLFGFDTVVISGADQKLQSLWGGYTLMNSSDLFHGVVVMGTALWGTVVGAMFGGIPTDRIGRKNTLFIIGIVYTVSALGTALANDPYTFALFRFMGGLGIGASTIAAPTYIGEIAPAKDRGKMTGLYQFNVVFGILMAYVSNFFISGNGENDWRWMLGVMFLPAIIYTFLVLSIPKSPRWLISRGRTDEAKKILKEINPTEDPEIIISQITSANLEAPKGEKLFTRKYRFPLMLAFLVSFFNQMSGINAFLYYSKRIFGEAGLDESAALLSSVGVGVTNLVFTLIGVSLIDKFGRRVLMYIGSIGYIISLAMVTIAFSLNWTGMSIPIFFFIFIASHAIGQGTIIWVYISEIFPNHLRASGTAFGVSTHWVLAAIIPSLVPVLFATIGATTVFLVFTIAMVFQLLFVIFMMPETKGISLEKLSEKLTSK